MQDQLNSIISKVCDIPITQVTSDLGPGDLDQWDSVKHVELIAAIEEEFGFSFDIEELESLVNVRMILAALASHTDS